jgi:predicted Zn-dependent peptidase
MTVVERDSEKALRYRGKNRVVVVVGDLTKDQLVRVASSLD